ncbi:probable ATP-dependent RNA helicase DDX60 [Stylophora pistillata]|uniref:probable ATP-dependent RNA helicase DDX60 n=1 Tax=Stylophora pistillata TaxID=50429 RepID=UPI000C03DA60|nr:probable ATP-dependent RNA helicase DDX60 [Stylophora pistillata]
MAEGGEADYSTSDPDSDVLVVDFSNGESDSYFSEDSIADDHVGNLSASEEKGEETKFQLEYEEDEQVDEKEEGQFVNEPKKLNKDGRPEEPHEDDADKDEKPHEPPPNLSNTMDLVTKIFYGQDVHTKSINILTDFADAEIFLIDGDSLLLEVLSEKSLDWSSGGQFLHLIYLAERFLQNFTEKGGVFHIIFLKEMEIIWRSNSTMLLAREALILHLQHNTDFTVKTSMVNFWGKEWKDYLNDEVPAFLLLADAEKIPFQLGELKETLEYFFRCLLFHCLAHGLNCVFISGIQTSATKVMGFYSYSSATHKKEFTKFEKEIWNKWQLLVNSWQDQAYKYTPEWLEKFPRDAQIDVKAEVRKALQPPPKGGCREVSTVVACVLILSKALMDPSITKEAMKTAEDKMKLFLLHTVLLNKLPLKCRAHLIDENLLNEFCKAKDGNVYPFSEIHMCLWEILKTMQVVQGDHEKRDETGNDFFKSVADLMDGRLIHTLFCALVEQRLKGIEGLILPEDVIEEVEDAWKKVVDVVNRSCSSHSLNAQFFPFAEDVTDFHAAEVSVVRSNVDSTMKLRRLTEVQSDLVNNYAGNIRAEINVLAAEMSDDEISNVGQEFDERYHWRSHKLLSDDYDRTKKSITDNPPNDPLLRKRYYKDKQKFARFRRFYGNSLVGGSDQQISIPDPESGSKKKTGKKKEKKQGKKAAAIIEERLDETSKKARLEDQKKWDGIVRDIETNLRRDNFSDILKSIDKFLLVCKFPELRLRALMKKVDSCFDAWKQIRNADKESNDMKYPVLLMESVHKIFQDLSSVMEEKNKKKLARIMQKLGFNDLVPLFYEMPPDREAKTEQLSVHTTSARFQLEYMGHLLKREERTDPDSRVENFIPDTWQRELLDAVDNNESAVIVAPTSSGKTYASYYCMEKVLRQDNDSVVVYVAPTKALVNQVVATVDARFKKKMPEGRSMCGVFTRDYRQNTLNSQILVTVPQCLEILFISPHRQHWTKNVKYVIFDEVHCIGSETGAEVWEHLLLMIRCPFLALSATIGNPEDLRRWLQAAQDFREKEDRKSNEDIRKSYRVRLVKFEERYSDLEKSIYLPIPKANEGSDVNGNKEFVRLHPCAQLGYKQLLENGFPGDMALTPKENLQLYDTMVSVWPDCESLQNLRPETYFLEMKLIQKGHARQYESDLKREFNSWADSKQLTKVQSVITSLNSAFVEAHSSTEEQWGKLRMTSFGKSFIKKSFDKLIDQLRAQEKLPALVFSDDRKLCEHLALGYAEKLEMKEQIMRRKANTREEINAQKRQGKAEKKLQRKRDELSKEKRYNCSPNRVNSEPDDQDERNAISASNEVLPECTLAFTFWIGKEDYEEIMRRIWSIPDESSFKRALKRGISFHHSGCNAKKRSVVEMLFRGKYLQVVNSTSTLALGIHMPCKTVVFAGDSPYLNSLQYRQMSGRAGRRGFDPLGNVIFFGIPYRKVQRLMTANIPKLVGNFPITVSLVLRLLLLTTKANDKKDALTKALALLSHPFICRKYPQMEIQIKIQFLFSVELLTRLSLVNKETGAPQEMAGLATHLHYHEPSNYVLVSFLQCGLFHKLCKPGTNGKFSENVMRKMVLVLSHLIGRTNLHPSLMLRTPSSSKVILEDLPSEFAKAVKSYNRRVTDVFSQYLATVAKWLETDRGEDNKLPLSGIEFPKKASIDDIDEHDMIKVLANSSIQYSACSSFAALSGNTDFWLHPSSCKKTDDEANSGEEEEEEEPLKYLLTIIRQDVYTDMNLVPILPVMNTLPLNAYALDFFKHGSSIVIENENGMQAGDVYNVLKEFNLTIKSISCSLEQLGPETDNVVLAFKQLAQEYDEKFSKEFQ